MKIGFRDIESFVKKPTPQARVILVYGPDYGLMRERASIMGRTIAPDLSDPFNVATLSTDILNDDPARLSDEAHAISMMGGDRLIRIEDAGDKLTPLIKEYLESPSQQTLVILEAGELGPRSSLRKLCEAAKNAAALPCYVEDERDLSRFIQTTLSEAGLKIDRDAQIWLGANISGDRLKVRGELEKLITYMGPQAQSVSIEDARAICGSGSAATLDEFVFSTMGGDAAKALRTYELLDAEGTPLITILRSLQNHVRRLHLTKCHMQDGKAFDQAIQALSPPIFFKQKGQFQAQCQKWPLASLTAVLDKLSSLEKSSKETNMPAGVLTAQSVIGLCARRR